MLSRTYSPVLSRLCMATGSVTPMPSKLQPTCMDQHILGQQNVSIDSSILVYVRALPACDLQSRPCLDLDAALAINSTSGDVSKRTACEYETTKTR